MSFVKLPRDITVKAGQPAKLQCSAIGHPKPVKVMWKKVGDDFPASREQRVYVLPGDDKFFIANTRSSDEGIYTCIAENKAGRITANATLTVRRKFALPLFFLFTFLNISCIKEKK